MRSEVGSRAETGSIGKAASLLLVPALEAMLLMLVALVGWMSHTPLVFTSLGPTAYELIEMPERVSARPYSIIMGHLLGLGSGFVALLLTHAGAAPAVSSAAGVPLARVAAAGVAAALTVFGTRLAKAAQPAAISTSLIIALGAMRGWRDAGLIVGAVLLMTAAGELVRRLREDRSGANGTAERRTG